MTNSINSDHSITPLEGIQNKETPLSAPNLKEHQTPQRQ